MSIENPIRKVLGQPPCANAPCSANGSRETAQLATQHRLSFKDAIGRLTGPAFRLHRYRNARTRMLRDALCELDCRR
jgi:hypothetical protein